MGRYNAVENDVGGTAVALYAVVCVDFFDCVDDGA